MSDKKEALERILSMNGFSVADLEKEYWEKAAAGSLAVAPNRATDIANSWWNQPRTYYDAIRERVYFTGVGRGGGAVNTDAMMYVGYFDLKTGQAVKLPVRAGMTDDHNAPALLLTNDLPALLFTTNHTVDSKVVMHKGRAPFDLENLTDSDVVFPGPTTYQHAHRKPGTQTLALLTRLADGIWMRRSTDWGATWDTAFRFHGKSYHTFKRNGYDLHYIATIHPTTGINIDNRYFKINLLSGDITNAAGTLIDNLWTMNTTITSGQMTLVRQYMDPESTRVLDVATDGSVLICDINKSNPELGGTYKVAPFSTGSTWARQTIVDSGPPVGYNTSSYVGGAVFGETSSEVFLTRNIIGTDVWLLEKWIRTGSTWSLAAVIHKVSGGKKLGRPQIPFLGESTKHILVLEYTRYAPDTYQDYYADQLLLQRP